MSYPEDSYQQIADAVTGAPLRINYGAEPPTTGYEVLGPPGEPIRFNLDAQPPYYPGEASRNG